VRDLPRAIQQQGTVPLSAGDNLRDALRAYEKAHILAVLSRAGNDKKTAAEQLGVSLSSLYRKIEELEIAALPESAA
jgi:transcriptional regulator with PAS, ATPase and Fis domain